ncbi:MAG: cohesin domain-containing protein [Acidobacteriota bacterium]|nr:cohesin domain-containing protein [Acidobacteriota bacterium]
MKFSKKSSIFILAFVFAAMSVFGCASQQSAETKPANNSPATQPATAIQQNPATQPNTVAQQTTATQPATTSKEPELDISLPVNESAVTVGSTLTVPVVISSKSNKEIFSFSFAVMFDPKVLQPIAEPISTKGTLSDGFMVASDTKTAGRLGIAAASGGEQVKPNGTLINTQFKVIGKSSGKIDLKLAQPIFEDSSGNDLNVNATLKQ